MVKNCFLGGCTFKKKTSRSSGLDLFGFLESKWLELNSIALTLIFKGWDATTCSIIAATTRISFIIFVDINQLGVCKGDPINQSSMCNSKNKVCIGTESNKWTRKNTKQLPFEMKAIDGPTVFRWTFWERPCKTCLLDDMASTHCLTQNN